LQQAYTSVTGKGRLTKNIMRSNKSTAFVTTNAPCLYQAEQESLLIVGQEPKMLLSILVVVDERAYIHTSK
jgi:hypothetical protein